MMSRPSLACKRYGFLKGHSESPRDILTGYFRSEHGLSDRERNTVYEITILFESSAMNLAHFAALLKDRPSNAPPPAGS